MRQITALELSEYLSRAKSSPPILLDVREDWEYRTCHIEGSLAIPMNDIPSSLDKLDQSKDIVVICHHGMRSLQVAYFLENAGFSHIINLKGGIDAWARHVDTSMPVY